MLLCSMYTTRYTSCYTDPQRKGHRYSIRLSVRDAKSTSLLNIEWQLFHIVKYGWLPKGYLMRHHKNICTSSLSCHILGIIFGHITLLVITESQNNALHKQIGCFTKYLFEQKHWLLKFCVIAQAIWYIMLWFSNLMHFGAEETSDHLKWASLSSPTQVSLPCFKPGYRILLNCTCVLDYQTVPQDIQLESWERTD